MKRFIIYLVVVAGMATVVTLKASQKREAMSELALINIEALSSNEYNSYYYCYGKGNVICPDTGEKVENYIQYFDLK